MLKMQQTVNKSCLIFFTLLQVLQRLNPDAFGTGGFANNLSGEIHNQHCSTGSVLLLSEGFGWVQYQHTLPGGQRQRGGADAHQHEPEGL